MPTFEIASADSVGKGFAAGSTGFVSIGGHLFEGFSSEARSQTMARSAYTLAKLLVRAVANATSASSTVTSRVASGAGAQSVSIGATLTGLFQDTTNSDSIASGSVFNNRVVTGAGGTLTLSIIAYTLAHATANDFVLVGSYPGEQLFPVASAAYAAIGGRSDYTTPEALAQFTFRAVATLSNVRMYVEFNTCVDNETITLRKNGANGNQIGSILAGTTGSIEDTTNSDSVAVGDEICYEYSQESGAGSLTWTLTNMKCISAHRPRVSDAHAAAVAADQYFSLDGQILDNTTEANVQLEARSSFNAANLLANVQTHGASSGVNLFFRVGGVNSVLTVTIPDSTTGVVEDTTNSVSIVSGDLYNWFMDHGGGAGGIRFSLLAFGGAPPASARSRVVMVG